MYYKSVYYNTKNVTLTALIMEKEAEKNLKYDMIGGIFREISLRARKEGGKGEISAGDACKKRHISV